MHLTHVLKWSVPLQLGQRNGIVIQFLKVAYERLLITVTRYKVIWIKKPSISAEPYVLHLPSVGRGNSSANTPFKAAGYDIEKKKA